MNLHRNTCANRNPTPGPRLLYSRPKPSGDIRKQTKTPKLIGKRSTMSEPYRKVKAGRLTFKGGDLATVKSIVKKKKKKHKNKDKALDDGGAGEHQESSVAAEATEGENIYTIDAAKKMKYEELFPVEAKKFGYDPKNKDPSTAAGSVEEALDDRVKKKADRYCK